MGRRKISGKYYKVSGLTYSIKQEAVNYIENRKEWWTDKLSKDNHIAQNKIKTNVEIDEQEKTVTLKIVYKNVDNGYYTDDRTITYKLNYLK